MYEDEFPIAEPVDVWFDDGLITASCFRCGTEFDLSEEGEGRGDNVYCQVCAEDLFTRCGECDRDYATKDFDYEQGMCANCNYKLNVAPAEDALNDWFLEFDDGEEGSGL